MAQATFYRIIAFANPDVERPMIADIIAEGVSRTQAYAWATAMIDAMGESWVWGLHTVDANGRTCEIANESGWVK